MAYDRGLPLLVVVEKGLKSEGLLEAGYDWFVQWVSIGDSPLLDREFLGVFADWKARVEMHHAAKEQGTKGAAPDPDYSKVSIGKIISSLPPAQLWAAAAAIVAALMGVAALAYKIGSLASGNP